MGEVGWIRANPTPTLLLAKGREWHRSLRGVDVSRDKLRRRTAYRNNRFPLVALIRPPAVATQQLAVLLFELAIDYQPFPVDE